MNIRTLKNRIRNRTWVFLKAKWQLRSGVGIVIKNDSDWFVYNEIFVNKEYDGAIELFLNNLPAQPVIVDLGANVGYFTLKIADELKLCDVHDFRIIAVEASPVNFAALQERTGQPALKSQVKAFLGMAGYKTGKQEIVHTGYHYGNSTFAEDEQNSKRSTIDYLDIEKLLPGNDCPIDFLKCDIEGSEETFIKEYKSLLMRTKMAVFEWHANIVDVENCRKLLEQAGLFSKGVLKVDPPFATSVEMFQRH